jgi:hypothetical protein
LEHHPVLTYTVCRSSLHHPPDCADFRHSDWANFQSYVEDQVPFDADLHNGMAIDTCVENFSGAVLKSLAVSTPNCRPSDDPWRPIPAFIQDELRLKNRPRRWWQFTRQPFLKTEVNRLRSSVSRHLIGLRNDQRSANLESLHPDDKFPTKSKHARVISILKPGDEPALPSSYQPISPLNTISKIFKKSY